MARIDLAKPYEDFLRIQVDKGLFRSITAAAEYAIAKHMDEQEQKRIRHIHALIAKGEEDVKEGRTIPYDSNLINQIIEKGSAANKAGHKSKYEVRGE